MMQNCDATQPGYGLETHKWAYGTEQQQGAITAKGGTDNHRTSFSGL